MKKKILLVEDSPILREGINNMLAAEEISIDDFAVSAQEAISLLDNKQYDMMIVDIELTQGNGFEVVKHTLSKDYPYKRPTFIMLTNNAYKHYRDFAKKLGIDYFFDKSMEFDLAIEKIESLALQ